MTVALSARRAALTPPWVKRSLWKAAREVPSWHIAPALIGDLTDLVAGQSLVTFTNSSPAWGFNSSGVLVQPTANVPFIEYDPATGSALGWRIWDAVTNLLVRSEDLTTTWTQFGVTVYSNVATAPNGASTADKLVDTSDNIEHGIFQSATTSGSHTFSVFAKAVERRYIVLRKDLSSLIAVFDLQAGTVTQANAGVTASITTCSNGWYRCAMTCTSTGNTVIKLSDVGTGVLSNSTYLGNGGGIFIWGAQLNTGPLAPYVPTGALAASSTADVASITGAAFAGIWNTSEGTIFAGFGPYANSGSLTNPGIMHFDNNTTANIIRLFAGASVSPVFNVIDASVIQAYLSTSAISPSSTSKIAAAYKLNDFARAVNGTTPETDAVGTVPTVTQMLIGNGTAGVSLFNGYIRELAIFKSRRPNANLQSMTQ